MRKSGQFLQAITHIPCGIPHHHPKQTHTQKLMNLNSIILVLQSTAAVSRMLCRLLGEHYTITEHVGCCVCITCFSWAIFRTPYKYFKHSHFLHPHSSTESQRRWRKNKNKVKDQQGIICWLIWEACYCCEQQCVWADLSYLGHWHG